MEQPKRRACDECRGRKMACSKEIHGCSRCKREGIKCVYSAQKRMGRPRKKRLTERSEPSQSDPSQSESLQPEPPHPHVAVAVLTEGVKEEVNQLMAPNFDFDPTLGMDLDLSFLDMDNMDMNFLEIADPNIQFPPPQPQISPDPAPGSHKNQHAKPGCDDKGPFWAMSHNVADINFDEPARSSLPTPAPLPEITAEEVAQIFNTDFDTLPSLSPPSTNSPSTQPSPADSDSSKICGCVTAISQALTSLQDLPKEVGAAMAVARNATKTAHDTILCPICSDPPLDPNLSPPIQSLQSVMMLGALLPSVSNAYMHILTMVDAEAAAADAERRQIRFSLSRYGGLWGYVAKVDPQKCGTGDRLENAMLEPILWRLTVRALLKMDVYGINEFTPGANDPEAQQPGLKDIINMMEERSRRRHEQMDALIASGVVLRSNCQYVPMSGMEKPTCMRIIEIAKRSMDDLIIP
ncbi:uncharacterized protein C8A04DRAFT_8829 [Dichotomopilus funicola]|uniref:Zn(2)-C6 fungal-type domain-containing protein n=1 Tax=Dichotomopilus funicola TaxID=1934379 RepID=A0AAN6VA45_9PEZI|nr:hypothetical protein C8A04DRAFT_8829 [Dichotomopilus funicola]